MSTDTNITQNTNPTSPTGAPDDPIPVPVKRKFGGSRDNAYPPYHSKIGEMLKDEHREEYEDMLLHHASVKALHRWLLAKGYSVGRCTVDRHRNLFLRDCTIVRNGAEMAKEFAKVAQALGITLPDAMIGGFYQVLTQFFGRAQLANKLDGKEVQAIAAGLKSFVDTHHEVHRVRRELEPHPSATGADDQTVVKRVRQILGIEDGKEG